jgi:hypothetical protein
MNDHDDNFDALTDDQIHVASFTGRWRAWRWPPA